MCRPVLVPRPTQLGYGAPVLPRPLPAHYGHVLFGYALAIGGPKVRLRILTRGSGASDSLVRCRGSVRSARLLLCRVRGQPRFVRCLAFAAP
jgi:hypothetical protein